VAATTPVELAEILSALEADSCAQRASVKARARLAEVIAKALANGMQYDLVARLAVRSRTGRAPTLAERRREIDRLRHLRHRHRMTERHGQVAQAGIAPASASVSSMGKERDMSNQDPPLLRRRVVEEIFEGGESVGDFDDEVDGPEDAEVDGETDGADEP
jgi:hypothetical protein